MTPDSFTITLGDEDGEALHLSVLSTLKSNGAIPLSHVRGIGGSQDVQIATFQIGNQVVVTETETYVEVSLTGERHLVERLAEQIAQELQSRCAASRPD